MSVINNLVGEVLCQVKIKPNKEFLTDNNSLLADEIHFIFDEAILQILPNQDTDEVLVRILEHKETKDFANQEGIYFLNKFVGKKFTFAWEGTNCNGYFDFLALSFYQLHPNLIILSEGSVLKIFEVSPLKKSN